MFAQTNMEASLKTSGFMSAMKGVVQNKPPWFIQAMIHKVMIMHFLFCFWFELNRVLNNLYILFICLLSAQCDLLIQEQKVACMVSVPVNWAPVVCKLCLF